MKRKIWRKTAIILTVSGMMALQMANVSDVYAELDIASLGTENNQIAAVSPQGTSAQKDTIALDDLGISVEISDYVAVSQSDGFVYIYTEEENSIPYVIVGCYDTDSQDFVNQFTQYMSSEYSDIEIITQPQTVNLGQRTFTQIEYSYTVSGYAVRDIRLFCAENGKTWMFGAKEVPELSLYTDSMLEEAAESFAYLAGGDSDYAKHVDSERSVVKGAGQAVSDIETAVGDVMQDSSSSDTASTGGTVGTVGGVTGSIGSTQSQQTQQQDSGEIVFTEASAAYTGTWVPFEDGFQLYLPSDWNVYDLAEEQTQQGVLYVAGDASGEANAPAMSVVWANSDGAETLDDLASAITQGGYQVDDIVTINGIGCVTYRLESDDCSAVMFFHPTNKQYVFCVTGVGYAENVDTICSVLTSLSPYR